MRVRRGFRGTVAPLLLGLVISGCNVNTVEGDPEIVRQLAQDGLTFDGATFREQARRGEVEAVRLFLRAGMPVDRVPNYKHHTTLCLASGGGHLEVMKVLLEKGADPNFFHYRDDGETPLMVVARKDKADAARLLLEKGAKVDLRKGKNFTPLMFAAQDRNPEVVKVLLEFGADRELKDSRGLTALDIAHEFEDREVLKLLLAGGK